jgi:dCMP deaminase
MENIERPSWDQYFMAIAVLYSSRGTCDRLRMACVLVNNKRIVGAGYNGSVAGLPSCDEADHLMIDGHCVRTIHGEDNAVANAQGSLAGATAYITAKPCIDCTKRLIQYGVKRVVYIAFDTRFRGSELVEQFCDAGGVVLERMTSSPEDIISIFGKIFARLQGPGGLFREVDFVSTLKNVTEKAPKLP